MLRASRLSAAHGRGLESELLQEHNFEALVRRVPCLAHNLRLPQQCPTACPCCAAGRGNGTNIPDCRISGGDLNRAVALALTVTPSGSFEPRANVWRAGAATRGPGSS